MFSIRAWLTVLRTDVLTASGGGNFVRSDVVSQPSWEGAAAESGSMEE